MQRNRQTRIADIRGNEALLEGLVSELRITKGAVTTYGSFYIHPDNDFSYDMLLGRPWQRDNRVSIDERRDGTYLVFNDYDYPDETMELMVFREDILPIHKDLLVDQIYSSINKDYSYWDSYLPESDNNTFLVANLEIIPDTVQKKLEVLDC